MKAAEPFEWERINFILEAFLMKTTIVFQVKTQHVDLLYSKDMDQTSVLLFNAFHSWRNPSVFCV